MSTPRKQALLSLPIAAVIGFTGIAGFSSATALESGETDPTNQCSPQQESVAETSPEGGAASVFSAATVSDAQEVAAEEPAADAPVSDEPAVEEPATEAPVTEEPVTEEPVTEEPVTEENCDPAAPVDETEETPAPVEETPAPGDGEGEAEGPDAPAEHFTEGTAEDIAAVFDELNASREAAGLDPVTFNVTLSEANQKFLNDFMVNWTETQVDPYAGTQIGWTTASLSMSYSHQGGAEGVLEAAKDLVADETSYLHKPETTYVGVAVAHPGNPGLDEETGISTPATYLTATFFDYPAEQKLPGSYADAAGAIEGYQPTEVSPFSDITTDRVFYKEMSWLAESGISKGWAASDGTKTYRPDSSVSRDVMAAFLYRWNGSPEYTTPETNRFRDVNDSHVFQKEMNWLADQDISNGWSAADGTRAYQPDTAITRGQMAAFLYRMAGYPDYTPPQVSPFTDVEVGQDFYKEMSWLAETGISNGWTAADGTKTYQPESEIHRDQMAAFLYRMAAVDSATTSQK